MKRKKKGAGRDPMTSFRLPRRTLRQATVVAESVGLRRSEFYRLGVEAAIESMSASSSPSLTGSREEPLADAS